MGTTDEKGVPLEIYRVFAESSTFWEEWIDTTARLRWVSPGAEIISGYTLAECRSMATYPLPLVHPEDHHIVKGMYNKALAGGKCQDVRLRIVRKDGAVRHVSVDGQQMFDNHNVMIGFRVSVRDVTELHQLREAQAQILDVESKFQLLFSDAPLGYQSLDEDGNFLDVNDAWLNMLGYTRDRVIGKWFGDFMTAESGELVRERFPILKRIGAVKNVEFEMVNKAGQVIKIALHGKAMYDEQGNFTRTHCIVEDITQRKATEREREQLIIELQTALSEVKQLSGLLPICSSCKNVRTDEGYWHQIERYIGDRSEAQFTHSICPECARKLYPDLADDLIDPDGK